MEVQAYMIDRHVVRPINKVFEVIFWELTMTGVGTLSVIKSVVLL